MRAQVQRQSHDEAQTYLTDNLELAVQAFLVFLENLDVVVGKSERTQPYGRNQHQHHVDVLQSAQQQAGDKYGKDDDDTSHARHTHFVHAKGVDAGIALCFGDLFPLQQVDELVTPDTRNEQGQNDSHQRAERRVGEHTRAGEVVFVQPLE